MSTDSLLEGIRDGKRLSLKDKIYLTFMLSLPSILARLTNVVMQYIDASMVGHIGANQSAAIGLVASTTWLFSSVGMALVSGFSIQTAQAIGAKNGYKARRLLWQSYALVFGFAIILSILGCGISFFLPGWLGAEQTIWKDATIYFLIYSLSLPFRIVKYLAGSMLQCSGNMKVPGVLNSLLCVLDVVFNYIFIYEASVVNVAGVSVIIPGLHLGVAGAALGTALADIVIAILMLIFLNFKTPIFKFSKDEKYSFNEAEIKKAISLSLPIAFEQIVVCGAMVLTTKIIAPLGIVAIAANSFAITAEGLCYMPGYGIGDAASTLVGQSIGAKRNDEAISLGRLSLLLCVGIMSILSVIMFLKARLMMELLTYDTEVIELGIKILRIEAFGEAFYGANIVLTGVFRGAGDTFVPSIMNLVSLWAVRIVLYFILTPRFGLVGAWIAMCSELVFRGIIFMIRFFRKSWIKRYIEATGA